jgi:hypothetical protein
MKNPALKRYFPVFAVAAAALVLAFTILPHQRPGPNKAKAPVVARIPLYFEANMGQTDSSVSFIGRGNGYLAFFEPGIITVSFAGPIRKNTDSVKISFPGASPAIPEGMEALSGKSNYFIGNDPDKWVCGAPHYGKITYRNIYPGVDLVFYGNEGNLEFDFIVSPRADPGKIRLTFDNSSIKTDDKGNLLLREGKSRLAFLSPNIYQESGSERKGVQGGFVLDGPNGVGFQVAAYDREKPLVIDPILLYSTFLGGASDEEGRDIELDDAGSILVTGFSLSSNFPGSPAFQGGSSFGDVFVVKMNPSGSALVYSTFIGGGSDEAGSAMETDARGNVYVAGFTSSPDFPAAGALDPTYNGGLDAFAVKLDSTGSLLYSTFLGGGADDGADDIAVDSAENIFLTGITSSPDFPSPDLSTGFPDAFASKINANGLSLAYSVLIGGGSDDEGAGIALDAGGNAYLTGSTSSFDFPVLAPLQGSIGGGKDAFAAKLDPAGTMLYSTFLGGGASDNATAIAVDSTGAAYISGSTNSSDFPTLFPLQTFSGATDAFLTRLNPSGNGILFSTFFGGTSTDEGNDLAFLSPNSVYLTGRTSSVQEEQGGRFPTVNSFDATYNGGDDAFAAQIAPAFPAIVYSSYLGAGADDAGLGMVVNSAGEAYLTGRTNSASGFPTASPFDPTYNGSNDAFAAKISNTPNSPPSAPLLVAPDDLSTASGTTVTFKWNRSTDPDDNPLVYELLVCTDRDFRGCSPVKVSQTAAASPAKPLFASFVFVFGLALAGAKVTRKRLLFAGVLILLALFLLSCGGGGGGLGGDGGVPPDEMSQTVSGLAPGTTYFWKVTAFDSMGGLADSAERSFQTP